MTTDIVELLKNLERRITYLETAKLKYFDDAQSPALALKSGGAGIPALEVFQNGTYLYTFTDEHVAGQEKQLFFSIQLPHSYKQGSSLEPHIHFAPYTNVAGNVKFGLEYTFKAINGTYGATTTIYKTIDKQTTAFKHLIASFGAISGTGLAESSIMVGRIFRNSSDTILDTYTDKVFLLSFDMHIENDKLGDLTSP